MDGIEKDDGDSGGPMRTGKPKFAVVVVGVVLAASVVSEAVPSGDSSGQPRLIGNELGVYQMDQDDHNQPSASRTRDSSPSAAHGTLVGVALVEGRFGSAYQFTGTNQYISIPDGTTSNRSQGTIMMWIQRTGTDSWAHKIMVKNNPGVYTEMAILFDQSNGQVLFSTGQCCSPFLRSNAIFPLGVWTHLAVSWGPQGKRIYVNGNLDAIDSDTTGIGSNSGFTYLGNDPNAVSTRGLKALLDEVRMYGVALAQSDIQSLMTLPYESADTTAPALTISLSGTLGSNGWYRSPIVVTLSCSDAESGVDRITYAVSGSPTQTYSGPFTISSNTGAGFVVATCYDRADNLASRSAAYKLDTVPPTAGVSLSGTVGNSGWYRSPITVTLSCADQASGVDAIYYSASGSPSTRYTGPFIVAGETGAGYVTATCYDLAGNLASASIPYKLDTTGPSGTLSSDRALAVASGYRLSWSAADALSGLNGFLEVQEQSALLDNSGAFTTICRASVSGPSQSGSCMVNPLPGRYCYRIVVSDLAGNVLVSPPTACTVQVAPTV